MAEVNPTRQHMVERLEELVAEYNAGTIDAERFFKALQDLVASLDEEQTRGAREGLSEDELAIFDLLTRPLLELTKAQEHEVKRVARELLKKVTNLVAGIDWLKGRQSRASVRSTIQVILNELPEEPYPEELWNGKVELVWNFVLRRYASGLPGHA